MPSADGSALDGNLPVESPQTLEQIRSGSVAGERLRVTLLGLNVGLPGALGVTRVLSSLLFGVGATDPTAFLAVALAACLNPAARAVRSDPMIVLEAE